jgi:hypothetical protein
MNDVPTRLLRETLRGRMAPAPSSRCIDTETLAAWSDGTLSVRERAAAESHASSCARCQALLAAMTRTAPWAPPGRWWHTSAFGWLASLATAAAALVLWINVARAPLEQRVAPPGTAGSASLMSASEPAASARVPSPTTALPPVSDNRPGEPKNLKRRNISPVPPVALPPQGVTKADEQRAAAATDALQPVIQPPNQANAAPNAARDTAAAPPPAAAPVAAPAPPRAEAPPQIATTEAAPTSNAVASAAAPKPLPPPGAMSDRPAFRAGVQALAKVSAPPAEIVSPNANVRWRILTGGSVARSTDGGTIWETQSTGVPATLTAGTAPSPTTCWLVGPGGIVVLSTDGRTWQRVPFPEAIDLTSIRAADGANATVTAADGRTFVTTDGGKTWR